MIPPGRHPKKYQAGQKAAPERFAGPAAFEGKQQRHECEPADFAMIVRRQSRGEKKPGQDWEQPNMEEAIHFGVRRLFAAFWSRFKKMAKRRQVGALHTRRSCRSTVCTFCRNRRDTVRCGRLSACRVLIGVAAWIASLTTLDWFGAAAAALAGCAKALPALRSGALNASGNARRKFSNAASELAERKTLPAISLFTPAIISSNIVNASALYSTSGSRWP